MFASVALPIAWSPTSGPIAYPPTLGTQVTAVLLPEVATELRRLQRRTKLSATDLMNRSISAYWFIDEQQRADRALLVRDDRTGETRLVQFL